MGIALAAMACVTMQSLFPETMGLRYLIFWLA